MTHGVESESPIGTRMVGKSQALVTAMVVVTKGRSKVMERRGAAIVRVTTAAAAAAAAAAGVGDTGEKMGGEKA